MHPYLVSWDECVAETRDVLELNLALLVVGPTNGVLGVVEHGS